MREGETARGHHGAARRGARSARWPARRRVFQITLKELKRRDPARARRLVRQGRLRVRDAGGADAPTSSGSCASAPRRRRRGRVPQRGADRARRGGQVEIPAVMVERRVQDRLETIARTFARRGIRLEQYLQMTGQSIEDVVARPAPRRRGVGPPGAGAEGVRRAREDRADRRRARGVRARPGDGGGRAGSRRDDPKSDGVPVRTRVAPRGAPAEDGARPRRRDRNAGARRGDRSGRGSGRSCRSTKLRRESGSRATRPSERADVYLLEENQCR